METNIIYCGDCVEIMESIGLHPYDWTEQVRTV
jgi:hypothetical protein